MSLALYRRYRPETFAEVIGQDHVTGPLAAAIEGGRVHHAFLFSGPRGCGKTTSARILARALNCEKGPTPTPCGTCDSCVSLAPGGSGSLDVIEIDAASHGGVDDARDLRERAFYAPATSRYKIYIIDEAHMVSREGFNALLKLVEEPPEHLKFVFATTEPDKVLPTIRSRTHHYAFRLVPPRVLHDHLVRIAAQEGVALDEPAAQMVVRAGAGSVRDALSVLDQLIAGAGDDGITAAYASGLLGYTDAQLLDDVVTAYAAHDGAAVFETLDRALDAGLDPRRFVGDLLERFRDLLVIQVAGRDAVHLEALVPAPPDALERLRAQAEGFGLAELTRNAEVLAAGLVEMRGATAPRLQLEILAARLLLPEADDDPRSLHARLDQLERQIRQGAQVQRAPARSASVASEPVVAAPAPPPAPVPAAAADSEVPAPATAEAPEAAPAASGADTDGLGVDDLRRLWPKIVDEVKGRKRSAWMQLSKPGAGIVSVVDGRVAVGLPDAGTVKGFQAAGYDQLLALAVADVVGRDVVIDLVVQPAGSAPASTPGAAPNAAAAAPAAEAPAPARGRTIIETERAAPSSPADDDPDVLHRDSDDEELSGEELLTAAFDAKAIGELDTD